MSKIILLNGPRECGKNVAVDHLKRYFPLTDRRCKDHLFTLMQTIFQLTPRQFSEIYNDRSLKEVPLPEFTVSQAAALELYKIIRKPYLLSPEPWVQLSIRDAMIYVSECMCKPAFGNDYFGIARAKTIKDDELAIDDSCGFPDEIKPTLDKLGEENVLLIRIRDRGSFEGDSRDFIPDGVVPQTLDVWNSGDESTYLTQMVQIAETFYKQKPHFVQRDLTEAVDELNGWKLNTGIAPVPGMVVVKLKNGSVLHGGTGEFNWAKWHTEGDIHQWRYAE